MIRYEAMKDYREILGKDKTSSIRQLLGITETKKNFCQALILLLKWNLTRSFNITVVYQSCRHTIPVNFFEYNLIGVNLEGIEIMNQRNKNAKLTSLKRLSKKLQEIHFS